MAGISRSIIHDWVTENISKVDVLKSQSAHIDELSSSLIEKERFIEISLSTFSMLIAEIKRLGNPVQPMLVIPLLSDSKKLMLNPPRDFIELENALNGFEPPSIYLVSWSTGQQVKIVEEYKIPLTFSLYKNENKANINTYYREHRFGLALKRNWEYSRGIYAEFYPKGKIKE